MTSAGRAAARPGNLRLDGADETRRWAECIFPFELAADERILVQPFWRPEWPNPSPGNRVRWAPEPYQSVDELCDRIAAVGTRLNVGVAIAVFGSVNGAYPRRKEGFARSATIGLDLDCGSEDKKKPFATRADAQAMLKHFEETTGIGPCSVVSSGTGLQAYFGLIVPCEDAAQYENMLKRFVIALHGDRAATDCTRVLRPPLSRNFKYAPPPMVRLLEASGRRYSWATFDKALPQLPIDAQPTRHSPVRTRAAGSGTGKRIRPPSKEIARLLGGAMPARYEGDMSNRDFFVACELAKGGASFEDLLTTMADSELGRQTSRHDDPDDYLRRTIAAAIQRPRRRPSTTKSSAARQR